MPQEPQDNLAALEEQIQSRYLIITVDDETGEPDLDGSPFAPWELMGLGTWLTHIGRTADDDAADED